MNIETVAGPFKKSGDFLSRFAHEVGDRLPHPNGIAAEDVALQGILKEFENRFAIADILDQEALNNIDKRAEETARYMAEAGLADEETTLELRLLSPESPLRDPSFIVEQVDKMNAVRDILTNDHGVEAISNTHPIMPTYEPGEEIDVKTVWHAVGDELGGFSRQMKINPTPRKLAVLALSGTSYTRHLFGEQVALGDGDSRDGVVVLSHVGERPEENLLIPHGAEEVSLDQPYQDEVSSTGLAPAHH